jgi:aerotolerance regulator-like protein
MTWLLPSALTIAGIACVALIAAHFIARDRPVAEPLPTARFIPDRRIHARTTSIALSDLLLLALRVAAVAALGLGVAGPIVAGARGRIARIVLLDRSRSALSLAEVRDSVRVAGTADVTIAFDSAARTLTGRAVDSIEKSGAVGSLSAALAATHAVAGSLSSRADSIEVAIVSPTSVEELDAATASIRALWPGRIRVMRVRPDTIKSVSSRLELPRDPSDAVVAGLSLSPREVGAQVRVVRARVSAADSAWGREAGHVLVHWPAADSATDWPARTNLDAIGGVSSASGAIVARLPRLWSVTGRAIARWADGEPAAVERPFGAGCIRDVAVIVDPASDVTLRAPFRDFSRALLAPCGGARAFAPIDSATLSRLAGVGPLAAARNFRGATDEASRFTPWLLAVGALLLLLELAVRRSSRLAA